MTDEIVAEIVIALADVQKIVTVTLEPGTSVRDALKQSGISNQFPDQGLEQLPIGIWGKLVSGDQIVKNGDRIELYRPLQIDPKEARRRLAESGRTMRQVDNE